MNAIKYLRNRFEFAIKNTGTIKVNNQDVEAINKLIDIEKNRNTDLEDALLLFYIFWGYTIENEKNTLKIKENTAVYPLGLKTPYEHLNRISKLIDPKPYVIQKIVDEIWIYQEYERVCQDQDLYRKEMYTDQTWEKHGLYSVLKITPQDKIPIPKDQKVTYDEVAQILEQTLNKAKEDFPQLKRLIH